MTILALDLGTSSCKAALVGQDGAVLAAASQPVAMTDDAPGHAEQDPEQILAAAERAVRDVLQGASAAPAAACVGAAMHSLLALDRHGAPCTPLYTWADARGGDEAARLQASGQAAELHAHTGTPVHASSPLCKLLWLRRCRTDLFARAATFVSMKELLLRRWLEDAAVVDESMASASGLYDLRRRTWHEPALRLLGIGPERLSRLVPTTTVLRTWRADVAARLGLPRDLPLVVGASDGALGNAGAGALAAGLAAVNMGSSAAARVVVDAPGVRPASGLFCYVLLPDRWVVGGAVNNGGLVLSWLGRTFFPDAVGGDGERRVLEDAGRSPAGSRGVRFQPYLTAERFPVDDSRGRAGWSNVHDGHRREDLLRAALEAVVLGLCGVVEALQREVGPLRELRGGGGMLRSALVAQMLADASGLPLGIPASVEVSALGAAWLARRALQGAGDEGAQWASAAPAQMYRPDPALKAVYAAASSAAE